MTERAPMTREEREAVLVEAAGGLHPLAAYFAANAALRVLASRVPGTIGLNIADIYKDMTARLDAALAAEEDRRAAL